MKLRGKLRVVSNHTPSNSIKQRSLPIITTVYYVFSSPSSNIKRPEYSLARKE